MMVEVKSEAMAQWNSIASRRDVELVAAATANADYGRVGPNLGTESRVHQTKFVQAGRLWEAKISFMETDTSTCMF